MNFVTVVFEKELGFLKTQGYSVDLYVESADVDSILVITNDQGDYQIDKSWWGQHQDRVVVVNYKDLGITSDWIQSRDGWNRQQIAKLKGAQYLVGQSVVLDAKTWFCQRLEKQRFIDVTGKYINSHDVLVPEVFRAGARFISDFFSIPYSGMMRSPSGVPFVMEKTIIDDMESFITEKTGQTLVSFFEKVDFKHQVTEFVMYSSFLDRLISQSLMPPVTYNNRSHGYQFANLARGYSEHDAEEFFDRILQSNTLTASIHRDAIPCLNPEYLKKWESFLDSKKLNIYI
jgi:hypothetical protein